MQEKQSNKGTEKLSVRAAVGEKKIGEIRLTLEGDPILRGSIEGFPAWYPEDGASYWFSQDRLVRTHNFAPLRGGR